MDSMNYWVGPRRLLKKVIARVSLFFVNDEEARM